MHEKNTQIKDVATRDAQFTIWHGMETDAWFAWQHYQILYGCGPVCHLNLHCWKLVRSEVYFFRGSNVMWTVGFVPQASATFRLSGTRAATLEWNHAVIEKYMNE